MKEKVLGEPIMKDGKRLAFLSDKSNTIHIVQNSEDSDLYKWAACNMGGRKDHTLYIDPSDVGKDYLVQHGEIIGKLCGNCSRGFKEGVHQ